MMKSCIPLSGLVSGLLRSTEDAQSGNTIEIVRDEFDRQAYFVIPGALGPYSKVLWTLW